MLKFIKKLLKFILILAIIAAVIGSAIGIGVYYWEKNEDKKDQIFNQKVKEKALVFFTNEDYVPQRFQGIKWEATYQSRLSDYSGKAKTMWEQGHFQKGFDKKGKLFFREVIKSSSKLAYYYVNEEGGLSVYVYWLEPCKLGSKVDYKLEGNKTTFTLRCGNAGKFLYAGSQYSSFDFDKDEVIFKLNAGGFRFWHNTNAFNMNLLEKNNTMLQLGEEVEAPVLIEFTD